MKVSIKKLEAENSALRQENREFTNQIWKLKEAEKDKVSITNMRQGEMIDYMHTANTNLMEIIRWQCNPETTKYPFVPEKGQLDQERFKRGF